MFLVEMQSGRWKRSHHRPDVIGEGVGRETFSEQQARYAKKSSDVGLVRADFQCLQGKLTAFSCYDVSLNEFYQRKLS